MAPPKRIAFVRETNVIVCPNLGYKLSPVTLITSIINTVSSLTINLNYLFEDSILF